MDENNQSAAQQPSAPSAPETVGNTGVSADIEKVLSFDPFGPAETAELNDGKGAEQPPKTGKDAVKAEGAQGKPAEVTPPTPPAKSPEVLELERKLAEATTQLSAFQKPEGQQGQPQQPQGQGQAQGNGAVKDELPDYIYTFPDPLLNALNSENIADQRVGLTTLTRGIARGIHQTVMNEVMSKVMPAFIQGAVQQMEQRVAQGREMDNMRTDFYSQYKQYDKPELKPIVGNLAIQLARELKVTSWTPEFRDQLASRVGAFLKTITGNPKPAGMTQGGGRSSAPPVPAETKDIMDTIF